MDPRLVALGWDAAWAAVRTTLAYDDCEPGRIAAQHRGGYVLWTAGGESAGTVSGRLRREARTITAFPAVGDWVLTRDGVIHALLPRRTAFARKAVLDAIEAQIVAANVDVVFVVEALDAPPNLRRIERYLTVGYESGARPAVLLNKSDRCVDVAGAIAAVAGIAPGTPIHALSARAGTGLEVVEGYCAPGRTVAFLGPSGVGKTTLLNALTGERRPTAEVQGDGRGRHTTTHRELVSVPGRGLVLDTPGMRELQLWDADAGLTAVFADIESLAARCRFDDCAHAGEPGCAVAAALAAGTLDHARYASFRKLEREEAFVSRKRDARARWEEKRRRRIFARGVRRGVRRDRD